MTDRSMRSWVESANDPETDFPIQNLPLGVFRTGTRGEAEIGVAIGNQILRLRECVRAGLLKGVVGADEADLGSIMAAGRKVAVQLRKRATEILREGSKASRSARKLLIAQSGARMQMPVRIGNYTDFYASIHHATNVGSMFRPDNPLLPNYKHVPIGYHGRASSIVVSGSPVTRPSGQTKDEASAMPTFGPTRRLDYEMELGAFIGRGNPMGEPIGIREAEQHLFGLCLLNDWSARDIQTWEGQPLGPFLAKNFATTISPWIVTLDALEPFRVAPTSRPVGDPSPLPYLTDARDAERGAFDITVEVWLRTSRMTREKVPAMRVSLGSFRDMYWTLAQLATHHTSNGCNMQPGDLIGSGTISGPTDESRGCMLERTARGTKPLELPTGERRAFLEDGDEVVLRAYCEREGYRRIGFGECSGVVTA